MKRAEWRMRADDPKTLLGWWWAAARRKGGVVSGLLLGGAAFAMVYGDAKLAGGLMLAGIVYQTLFGFFEPNELARLLGEPSHTRCFPALATYRRCGLVTGRDEVALSFIDGWLHAEGLWSEFSLRAVDTRRGRTGCSTLRLVVPETGDEILFNLARKEEDFFKAFEHWHSTNLARAGASTLPPAKVHPDEILRSVSYLIEALVLAGVGSFFHQAGWGGFVLRQGTWLVGLVLVLVAGRHWWRLMSLDAEARKSGAEQAPPLQRAAERTIEGGRAEVRNSLAE